MNLKLLSEFRDFALKGNVVDLAVGVIIGAAFGKIVSALVENVLMPPIGYLLGGVDFRDLAINLGTAQTPVLIRYGVFIQTVVDFAIIAFVLFMVHQDDHHHAEALRRRAAGGSAQAHAVGDLPQGNPRRPGEEVAERATLRELISRKVGSGATPLPLRGGGGGEGKASEMMGFTPPLTPPHQGEGDRL